MSDESNQSEMNYGINKIIVDSYPRFMACQISAYLCFCFIEFEYVLYVST